MANTLDLVRARGRKLAREAYNLAGRDLDRCPHNPAADTRLRRELGRVPSVEELRVLGHAYRNELHALNAVDELQQRASSAAAELELHR